MQILEIELTAGILQGYHIMETRSVFLMKKAVIVLLTIHTVIIMLDLFLTIVKVGLDKDCNFGIIGDFT